MRHNLEWFYDTILDHHVIFSYLGVLYFSNFPCLFCLCLRELLRSELTYLLISVLWACSCNKSIDWLMDCLLHYVVSCDSCIIAYDKWSQTRGQPNVWGPWPLLSFRRDVTAALLMSTPTVPSETGDYYRQSPLIYGAGANTAFSRATCITVISTRC